MLTVRELMVEAGERMEESMVEGIGPVMPVCDRVKTPMLMGSAAGREPRREEVMMLKEATLGKAAQKSSQTTWPFESNPVPANEPERAAPKDEPEAVKVVTEGGK